MPPPGRQVATAVGLAGGQLLNTGFSMSFTVTVCGKVFVFPWTSVTVQVTSVSPGGRVAGALFATIATPQLSPVIGGGSDVRLAVHWRASVGTITVSGPVIVGFSPSLTRMSCWQVALWPSASLALQAMVVVP